MVDPLLCWRPRMVDPPFCPPRTMDDPLLYYASAYADAERAAPG